MKKRIVISAIALKSGGTLSILQDCLRELSKPQYVGIEIHVLLRDRQLAGVTNKQFNIIELDGARSYWRKFYYEYFYFKRLSRKLNPDLWISLHDVTPNVESASQVVYCHNPAIFYKISWREFLLDPKFGMFTIFYGLLYRKNIHRNSWIIVQQDWIRNEFFRRFSVPKEKIIVAHPTIFFPEEFIALQPSETITFFYPTYPRVFKNIEIIGKAVQILNEKGIVNFKVILTVDGTENGYARWLKVKFGHLKCIDWIGTQPREKVYQIYSKTDCLIFPSKLETWGLPISEFKPTGRPILVPSLPYSKETIGYYGKAVYFDPHDEIMLADKMQNIISGDSTYAPMLQDYQIEEPATGDWTSLFKIIL